MSILGYSFVLRRPRTLLIVDGADGPIDNNIEVVPVVVVSQTFPARPSSIPDIRDFVRRCLAQSPLSEEDNRSVGQTVSHALLDAAGPTGAINVSFRIFPDHVEVDVLRSSTQLGTTAGLDALSSLLKVADDGAAAEAAAPRRVVSAPGPGAGAAFVGAEPASPVSSVGVADDAAASFADWMAGVLRREGLTMEAAARQLGVSVKTVSRWVGGATEPRLRDLRRIRELFGDLPFP
jgi:Helix-turn-helix